MPERKETFEAQAAAVRSVLKSHRGALSAADQKHLECAARNLDALGRMRRMVVTLSNDEAQAPVASDAMTDALIQLLHVR